MYGEEETAYSIFEQSNFREQDQIKLLLELLTRTNPANDDCYTNLTKIMIEKVKGLDKNTIKR